MSIVTSGGLQVVDANAQAGFHSCIRVSGGKNEQILFDCGVFSLESVNANWVFITHGHTDHVGAWKAKIGKLRDCNLLIRCYFNKITCIYLLTPVQFRMAFAHLLFTIYYSISSG
jgi:ribonuclease BN (tRNA processing enzyme)